MTSGDGAVTWPQIPQPVSGLFTLAGRLDQESATVELVYGIRGREVSRKSFTVKRSDATPGDLLQRHWAQKQVDDLLVDPKENAAKITEVGTRFGIVTPTTSLIVLETLAQYLEHGIRPPKMLKAMRREWDVSTARKARDFGREERDKLEQVVALWQARVAWWNTKFEIPKGFRFGQEDSKTSADEEAEPEESAERPAPRAMQRRMDVSGSEPDMDSDGAPDAPMAKSAEKKEAGPGTSGEREATISITPWDPQTPYLAALEAAPAARLEAVYYEQRAKHGTSPAFFLDCADFFHRRGDSVLGLQILSNIAELELENPALIRILAHRLAQLDRLTLSALLFERVRELRPEEPQSYRDLALVLARRAQALDGRDGAADYERAIALLTRVVMNRWDRFAEIELMALTELNNIIPKAKKAGVETIDLDKRLIQPLDMDVRIVMSWDADLTDMDLHVVEPSEEEAYYGHNQTTIGGIVSRDFTQGYGPEAYLLRRAMGGKYRIRTKYFGSSAAQLAGAVTLSVDVFTNYGRSNEERKSITFRLTEAKETFTLGTIEL